MGKYLNPGNEAFTTIVNGDYIDKSGVIEIINRTINTSNKLTCISRPRRFGKSFTANMLCAYYDCSCDSHNLFDELKISKSETYEEYLNKYNVVLVDVTGFTSTVKQTNGKKNISEVPEMIANAIREDIIESCPQLMKYTKLEDCLYEFVKITGRKIVFIIDEWDALIREAKDDNKTQEAFLNMLRGLFKNSNFTPYVVAAAYMTGILPIKKDGSQSAISDFEEYTILDPAVFTKFTGFTEDEVREICSINNMSFDDAKNWYDGYSFGDVSIYNPYSVMTAMKRKKYRSYWRKTSAADSLETYVNMDFDGLKEDVIRLISGEKIEVSTFGFANDFRSFKSKDDVLTLMIHLGYLTYDEENELAFIPNEEVRSEFIKLLENGEQTRLAELIIDSKKLLSDTISGNEESVALAIEK